jgi:hypothetical protein
MALFGIKYPILATAAELSEKMLSVEKLSATILSIFFDCAEWHFLA